MSTLAIGGGSGGDDASTRRLYLLQRERKEVMIMNMPNKCNKPLLVELVVRAVVS